MNNILQMTTQAVVDALDSKTPVERGEGAHDKTFRVKASQKGDGLEAEITGIKVKEEYSLMHYNLRWSTKKNHDIPYSGPRCDTLEDALEKGEKQEQTGPITARRDSSIALLFETFSGDAYHFKYRARNVLNGELMQELLMNTDPSTISTENPVPATYKPTSERGGELHVQTDATTLTSSRRAFEGMPEETYVATDEVLAEESDWVRYRSDDSEWMECSVLNAYDDDDGDELVLLVETPLGKKTAFTFNITPRESTPYWELVEELAAGDPANLSDIENSVYLRHHSRSFYQYGPWETKNIVSNRIDGVLSIDVNKEWELRLTAPEPIPTPSQRSSKSRSSNIYSQIKSYLDISSIWTQ